MNWEQHFRNISRRDNGADFGTIMGMQTVAELKDLITAKDNEMGQVQAHFNANPPDPDLASDWKALQDRYNSARSAAEVQIGLSFTPDDYTPAQAAYDGIIKALQQNPGTVTKGDLQDVYNRSAFTETPIPQPTAPDVDLQTYQKADALTQSMPGFVKRGIATFVPSLVPKTKDSAAYKPLSTWEKYAFFGAVAFGGLVAGKIMLKGLLL